MIPDIDIIDERVRRRRDIIPVMKSRNAGPRLAGLLAGLMGVAVMLVTTGCSEASYRAGQRQSSGGDQPGAVIVLPFILIQESVMLKRRIDKKNAAEAHEAELLQFSASWPSAICVAAGLSGMSDKRPSGSSSRPDRGSPRRKMNSDFVTTTKSG